MQKDSNFKTYVLTSEAERTKKFKEIIWTLAPVREEKCEDKIIKTYRPDKNSTYPVKTYKYNSWSYYLTDYITQVKYVYRPWEA